MGSPSSLSIICKEINLISRGILYKLITLYFNHAQIISRQTSQHHCWCQNQKNNSYYAAWHVTWNKLIQMNETNVQKKKKHCDLSPRANYTDRVTAARQRS
jgi:hypothetical protein